MTVFEAEQQVRDYWESPVRSPLLEAARYERLLADLAWGLREEASLRQLYARLGFERRRTSGICGMVPIWTLLAECIDRRARLDLPRLQPDEDKRFGRRGRDCRQAC